MTPSGWHDDAQSRDAGHDEMQVAIYEYLRREQEARQPSPLDGEFSFVRSAVYFEMPICRDDRVVAWADVAEIWNQPGRKGRRIFRLYEIKPRIYSIGALVRQCTALEIVAKSALATQREDDWWPEVEVLPVVRSDDPKLPLLWRVAFTLQWDGSSLI